MNNNTSMTQPLFDAEPNNTAQQKPLTLVDKLAGDRQKWTQEVTELNDMMKTLPKVNELLNVIYTKRQECVDYHTGMEDVIIVQKSQFKQQYNNMFNNIKINGFNGIRYNTDTNIIKCIEGELAESKKIIDMLENHNNYIKETIATLDNLIYGINQKIKLAEILNGLKF